MQCAAAVATAPQETVSSTVSTFLVFAATEPACVPHRTALNIVSVWCDVASTDSHVRNAESLASQRTPPTWYAIECTSG